jgi:hypothetical protein
MSLFAFMRGWAARSNGEPGGPLYHVTFFRNLEGIAEDGLLPAGGGRQGLGNYGWAHKARGVFVSEAGGLIFWLSKAEDWANHRSDRVLDEGYVPVVLRVPRPRGDLEEDELGAGDAREGAWILGGVPPEDVEVWDGRAWLPVGEWERVDPALGVTVEDDDEGDLQWLKGYDSPLTPPEGRR